MMDVTANFDLFLAILTTLSFKNLMHDFSFAE